MRYLRLLIGFFILFGSLYVIVVEQMTGASSNAFINARLLTVRAPVAGDIALPERAPGAFVREGMTLFSVEDERADSLRLNDLRLERDLLTAELSRLEAERDARYDGLAWLRSTANQYGVARIRELEVLTGENDPISTQSTSGTGTEALEDEMQTSDEAKPDRAPEFSDAFSTGAVEDFADLRALQIYAARRSIYLDNSAGAAWNMAFRQREAQDSLELVEADIARAVAQLEAYDTRIDRELSRLVTLRGDTLFSPVNGVLWRELTADGVNVQRGDPVLQIANCDSLLVTLSVSETIYNSLSTGSAATFRPLGNNETMQGTVARLAGAGAASVYEGMAVSPSEEHLERYDVALILPDLRADAASGCGIGRTGRVFFDERPLDIFWKLWE
ncbi:HlyD family efflux transporter periplasmic adaptor subunit [Roseovarius aestuariivivens]|uniref:HlyD family efflux transporter periplasmic adaptor subunit n=1 Tax=Roseovarius aestuariivivens TaxID=1888910 RepID=UPI0010808D47|nr:HlyD family secretion protein [Roseovarius aestuariivivens]